MFDVLQKITLDDLTESMSALDEKSADPSHSVNSMQTATQDNSSVAVYEVSNAERLVPLLLLSALCNGQLIN